jgi:hypothetical protein
MIRVVRNGKIHWNRVTKVVFNFCFGNATCDGADGTVSCPSSTSMEPHAPCGRRNLLGNTGAPGTLLSAAIILSAAASAITDVQANCESDDEISYGRLRQRG